VDDRELKELEEYFRGYGSPHDEIILKLIEQNKCYRGELIKAQLVVDNAIARLEEDEEYEQLHYDLEEILIRGLEVDK